MVEIVSGLRAGLSLASGEVLGFKDLVGGAQQGRNGQEVAVNIASGQLVVQDQDDLLVARGQDAPVLRTYNSNGSLIDHNADGWASGIGMLVLSGVLNTAGSTIQRVDADGAAALYTFDAGRAAYVSTEGGGAYDTIAYVATDEQYEWRDGASGTTQRYEGSGAMRLVSSKDQAGNAVAYAYGANGFLSAVTTASGESVYYDYSGNNLAQVRTVAAGVTTTRVHYGYDASNRLASVVVDLTPADNSTADGKVYQTTYTYDGSSKRIASITQADGTSVAFTYVDAGGGNFKVATVRDALNQTTSFTYGMRFTTVTDPLGLVTRYDYDASAQITAITGPAVAGASAVRQFAYDATGNVLSVTDGEGKVATFQYDGNGNQVLQRDVAGDTITRSFDARNQLLSQTTYTVADPDGAGPALPSGALTDRWVYEAGARNLLRFSVSAAGNVMEYRYDGFGQRVASITYAGALYPVQGLAPEAALTESTVAGWASQQDLTLTQRVDLAYDARGQLQARTSYARVASDGSGIADGSQSVQRYVYSAAGQLLQTVSATNGSTTFTYDGLGRALATTNALGQVTVTQYDDVGRKTLVTQANGLLTTSSFDAAGRMFSVVQSNAAGAALGETRYFYDAENRLRMTQDPTGVRKWTLYDEAGRKTADIDGNGSMTEYAYDRRGLVTSTMAWGTAINTAALIDATGLPVLTLTAAGLRPAESANDRGEWRQYDAAGRLVRTATSTGMGATALVTELRYDGASRLVQTVSYASTIPTAASAGYVGPGTVGLPAASAQDRVARNFYDDAGRLAGTLDAEGWLTVQNYTAAGQLSERVRFATGTDSTLRAAGTLAQLTPAASASDIHEFSLYDGEGRVVGRIDGEGYLTESVYDGNGNETWSTRYATRANTAAVALGNLAAVRPAPTPQDRCTLRSFDSLDRLMQETSPEGVVTQYAYDSAGNLVSTVRAAGTGEVRTLLVRYDVQGRLTGELSAVGASLLTGGQTQAQVDAVWAQYGTSYSYDAASRRISSTDPPGNRTVYFYNADGALTFQVNALGEVQERRYDARGRLTDTIAYASRISTTGLAGGLGVVTVGANPTLDSRTSFTYTRDSQLASTTDAVGTVTASTYNAFGAEIGRQVTGDGVSLLETYSIDRRGLRIGTVQDAAGLNVVSSAVYDAFGRLTRSIDGNGNVREQSFDRLGRVVTTRDPANALRATSYDAFSRVLTQADALGNVTSYAYDASARTLTVTTAEGIVTRTTYTRHGQVQSITDANGQATVYRYDADGNQVQASTPLTTTSSAYDAADRLVTTTDANGSVVAYAYDAANRVLTRRVDPNGLNLTTAYQYDAKGQRVSVTDANGILTTTEFDRMGRTTRQTVDPAGLNLQTTYTLDGRGKVLTVRTPGGTVTQYSYDSLGRRIQERVDPNGLNLQRSWSYDRNGNVLTSTDARQNVTRYAYDADDRLVFTVDPLGNVRQEQYDAEGRVVKTIAYVTPIALTGLPTTPSAAQVQALVAPQVAFDAVENRVYDKDGRMTATVDGTGAVVRYVFDGNGNVVTRTAYANTVNLATWQPGSLPTPVADAARDETIRTVYDALNRAVYTIDGIGAVVSRAYDGNGNVVQRTAYSVAIATNTAATTGALAAAVAAVASPGCDAIARNTFDAAGRLTWTADGTGAVTQNVYDNNGNVVRQVAYTTAVPAGAAPSTVAAGPNDRATSMAYDSANRLVLQVDALRGVTEQVLDADGHVLRRTAYANPIASVPTVGAASTAGAIRSLLKPDTANDRSTWLAYDAAGRQVLAVDALGAVVETRYDAAGNVTATVAYANPIAPPTGATPTLAALTPLVAANPLADRLIRKAYDAAGQLVYTVDAIGAVQARQYDGAGRLLRTTRYATPLADGTATTASAIAATVRPLAGSDQVAVYSYNAAGQLISATDALNATETYGYDALGHKLSFGNKSGFTWTYTYDAAGRMLTETTPKVQLTSASLDGAGNIALSSEAPSSVVTRLAYDALGNLTRRTEAAGRPEERTTTYEYDALGRQVHVVYPAIGVYNAAGDAVTSNGAVGVASRVETLRALESRTWYDTLGNAVANRDVGDAISQKVYDVLGHVSYEIDALGYVTAYARNAFGDVTSLTRYGAKTALASTTITAASQAATKAQVAAALGATGFDHSKDRVLQSTYDRAGRLLQTQEPTAFVSQWTGSVAQTDNVAKTTLSVYDAFGQLVQQQKLVMANTWATTSHYFDVGGREVGTVDALGYLTSRVFDVQGNLTKATEFANAVAPGWTVASHGTPAASADDRATTYGYDLLNRKTSETRLSVEASTRSDASSSRLDLTTRYEYDAVGNQTRAVDAAGNATISYYDALGRVAAIAAPAYGRTQTGATANPVTAFRRDAHGNVVAKTDYAILAVAPTPTSLTPPVADANDRTVSTLFDVQGRAIQTTDAIGNSQYSSYDAYAHLAKQWQGVTGNDGITHTAFELDLYDKLGRLVETRTPASTSLSADAAGNIVTVSQAQAGVVSTVIEYDGFGDITRKGTQGGGQEYFEYDNAGRLWRTNSGDGVDRINLYDGLGNITAQIRSSGSGRDDLDIKSFANAQAAAANPSTRREDIQVDALGRVISRTQAARLELQGGVSVQQQYTTATVQNSATVNGAANQVALTWNSLARLGSGDIRVTIEYRTSVYVSGSNESGSENGGSSTSTAGGYVASSTIRSFTSGVMNGDACASGATLRWSESSTSSDLGVSSVTRIVVLKKDTAGNWVTVVDQTPGYGANEIDVAAPPDPNAAVSLQLRAAGSTGDTGWWEAGLNAFGAAYRFNAAGLAVGSYEYRVLVTSSNQPTRITGTGTVAITPPPLNVISTPIQCGQGGAGAGILTWASPGASWAQVFRFRPNGSTGAWTALPVTTPVQGFNGVNTSALGAGTYQFELLWTVNGQNVPTAHATGAFTVVASKPAYWVPPVNLPPITGMRIGMTLGTPYLIWNAANATVAQYRVPGGAWVNLAIDNSGQTLTEGPPTGTQQVYLAGVPVGSYQLQILAGSPPAQATANLTVNPPTPGYYVTVNVQVPTYVPIITSYAPVYETRYATRTASYWVWVGASGYRGTDEAGNPIYAVPAHYEIRYYTETYSYQVQVGQRPVYATDENGKLLYQTVWVTQAQQKWVPPVPQPPTLSITTPAYTPGYLVASTPTQYAVSVNTAAGSAAWSTADGAVVSQSAGLNGDARWLRPVVQQKTDRWGNVVQISDPRAAYWITTYRYNASNQLVQQSLPDVGAGAAVTSLYYDVLGRQVATRDANGHVNGQSFDAAGHLVTEVHADGGIVSNAYNVFGQKVSSTDAMGNVVTFAYDKLGHLLRQAKGPVDVYAVDGSNNIQSLGRRTIVETWSYDQLGRKLTQANGNGETLRYSYDLAGNIVATQQAMGQVVRDAYDPQGFKIAEVDANGNASAWTYDYFGKLTSHSDLGGVSHSYTYDNARQLVSQTSSAGQNLAYSYDAAGQLTTIQDWANGQTTTYVYDLGGRTVRERVVQGGITYQDNNMAWDARGNLRDVADARVHVVMDYDAVGNRTHVGTYVDYQGAASEVAAGSERYYQYDAMNRQVVIDAADAAGNLGAQGHSVSYDKNGNRTSDTSWGSKVVSTTGPVITGYDEHGLAVYGIGATGFAATTGYSTEAYKYDALNRLWSVEKDGVQIDLRYYDGADRVMQSGPGGALPQQYANLINQGLTPDQMNGKEGRINRYDANGRLLHQRVLKSDNSAKLDISWDPNENIQGYVADGYDAAGNVVGYTVTNHDTGVVHEYTLTTKRFDSYQSAATHGVSTKQLPGDSTQQYDANGFLVGVVDSSQHANDRTLVNDATGHALYVNQGGNIQRQLVVNGEVLGTYGVGVDPNNPASGANNNPNFANVVDFDFGYARVSASYPSASPGAYTVRSGDTLQSIAQTAYGDSSLWFRIADANGLASGNDLKVGQTLNIPNRVSTISNNASTFKPYDPSKIEGDKTPSLATPVPKKKHNWWGQLLMAVVMVAAVVFTAGVAATAMGVSGSVWSAGFGVLTGGAAGGATGALASFAVGGSALGTAGTMALAAAGGSILSQAVGIATGVQDKFSWTQVGLSAIGGGVSAGLAGWAPLGGEASALGNTMVRSAVVNATTQGIGVVTGLQAQFDWRGVAASAFGAGAGEAAEAGLGPAWRATPMGDLAARSLKGLAAGTVTAVMHGGTVAIQRVAVDAFGNAVGESLAEGASSIGSAPAANTLFPDQLHASAPLPDMAEIGELNRQIAGYSASPVDPEDMDLVASNEGVSLSKSSRGGLRRTGNSINFASSSDYAINADYSIVPPTGLIRLPTQIGSTIPDAAVDFAKSAYTLTLETAGALWNSVAQPALSLANLLGRGVAPNANWFDRDPASDVPRWSYRTSYGLAAEKFADVAQLFAGGYTIRGIGLGLKVAAGVGGVLYSTDATAAPLLNGIRKLITPALGDSIALTRVTNDGVAIIRTGDLSFSQVSLQSSTMEYRNRFAQLRELDPTWRNLQSAAQEVRDGYSFEKLSLDWRTAINDARALRGSEPWIANRFESAAIGSYVDTGIGIRMQQGLISGADDYLKMRVGPDLVPRAGEGLKMEITNYTPSLNAIATHAWRYPTETMRYILYRASR
ncbi:LysM peptidoglycan-binding domain-containing protein [Ramlibacter ginsenosidimutans]|uniref:LysM peptidoglycan-binding domain-containing protein n=1 Tax=Ramlibacter ginsenosidimutans TaxID=502333 RepID=A0A934TSS4_9BURK|nr:LysM peptidoglycan-binding domain-containing protein [Ramlibacter ginsenosidimutans]MBK6006911.1 LysM peptidoglycan-binding domain-containing protein [Ramlibacter ginsenosidimutans]